jgi:predicted enzyme related to lactoylglutathione lyase
MILMPVATSPMMDEATATSFKQLLAKGAIGCGVLETDDCQRTYDDLVARGVEFKSPPAQRPYGLEATFKDNSGNWFSLVQRPR